MIIKGNIKDVTRIVFTDPCYDENVWCKFQKTISAPQDFDIEVEISDYYDDSKVIGNDIRMQLFNRKYMLDICPLVSIDDGKVKYNSKIITQNDYELGMDTARMCFGINEKADEIIIYSKKEETMEDIMSNKSDAFALNTGTDGYFGDLIDLETIEEIPAFIEVNCFIDKDFATPEELKD